MSIDKKTTEVIQEFAQLDSWEAKYKKLIEFGKKLGPIDARFKLDKFLVKGCQSQVWLAPEMREKSLHFFADSDALIVKGIVSLLVYVYSGEAPEDILNDKGDFLSEIGITNHLSMNRSNGLSSMMKSIKLYATVFQALNQK